MPIHGPNQDKATEEKNKLALKKRNKEPSQLMTLNTLLSFGRLFSENSLANAAIRNLKAKQMREVSHVDKKDVKKILGQHMMGEFFLSACLNIDIGFLRKIFVFAAKKAGATVLTSHFMTSPKGGISGVVVIAESHFIIHTIPSENYLALDLYTCGEMDTNIAFDYIKEMLKLKPYDKINFKRGIIGDGHEFVNEHHSGRMLPGIAVENGSMLRFFNIPSNIIKLTQPIASHCVGELYCSNPRIINDGNFLLQAFCETFDIEFNYYYVKQFEPQGVSLVLMGDGIHVTTHPWPELEENYTPVDIFVNKENKIDVKAAMERLAGLLHSQRYTINEFPRGVRNANGILMPVLNESLENDNSYRYV